jgi:hypothetical protein
MATLDHRQLPPSKLIDGILEEFTFDPARAVMHKNDSPFERVFAMATQQNRFDVDKAVKPPRGANKKAWIRAQELLFQEARAKLEFNPIRRSDIQGPSKYFGPNQIPLGDKTKVMNQIIGEMRTRGRNAFEAQPPQMRKELRVVGRNFDSIMEKVQSWSKNRPLKPIEVVASSMVDNAAIPKSVKKYPTTEKKIPKEWSRYLERQKNESDWAKSFNELHAMTTFSAEDVARQLEALRKSFTELIPKEERKTTTKNIVRTDYVVLRNAGITSKKQADEFMSKWDSLYKDLKPHIDQASTAIARPENQIGFFHDSAFGIVKQRELDESLEPIIDQMISIKAMNDKSWEFIDTHGKEDWLNEVLDILTTKELNSREMFKNNPEGYVKGWVQEIYTAGKTVDKDGNIVRDIPYSRQQGAIPQSLTNNTVGTRLDGIMAQ